jgi:hypothetical protein
MTLHLSDVEVLAAADGGLDATRASHVADCAACQKQIADAAVFLSRVASDRVPEPSPLFWDHFARRVREATHAEPVKLPARWSWRAWVPLAATAATVLFAAWLVRQPMPTGDRIPVGTTVSVAGPGESADEIAWESVLAATPQWADDDLFVMAEQDAMSFDDLTDTEKATFVRLLEEMEVRQ